MAEMPSDSLLSQRSPELLDCRRSRLVIVDVQEKLIPVISGRDSLLRTVTFLQDAAALLNVPTVVSEQYPQGLGPTIEEIAKHPTAPPAFDKMRFSAAEGIRTASADAPQLRAQDADDFSSQYLLIGIESHICVLQTALDLLAAGNQVFVAADAVGSRHDMDHTTGLNRMRDCGVVVCTAESAAFEWCEAAGSDAFRGVSRLVRALDEWKRSR